MSLFYSKVVAVLAQPPHLRSDFEIQQFLPWFSKKSDLFRSLKPILLHDVLKHCGFVKKVKDDIIIKQGEKGDCFFIILSGKVTIYIHYAKVESASDETDIPPAPEQTPKTDVPLTDQDERLDAPVEDERRCRERNKIGTFVCSLGPGDTFGEVALLSEDCIRTASIVADESTDLIAIDRDLYNRSVKNFIAKEFEDKSNFIAASEYFSNWSPKYRKQLAMALRKETYNYDTAIVRQGDPVTEIYFIISGEVKMTINPISLRHQYANLCRDEHKSILPINQSNSNASQRQDEHEPTHSIKYKRPSPLRKAVDLCLLGRNEIIGDIEVLLDMDTYIQSAVCTQRTEVLVLEMKHYERLLVKRNPHAIELMKNCLHFKLKHRFAAFMCKIPLLRTIVDMAAEFNRETAPPSGGIVTGRGDGKRSSSSSSTSIHYASAQSHHSTDSFSLPPRGPVIDLHGPGTVFHRIRTREKAKQKRKMLREKYQDPTQKSTANVSGSPTQKETSSAANDFAVKQRNMAHRITVGDESFYELLGSSDSELSDLERRMKVWMGQGQGRLNDTQRFPCVTPDRIPIPSKDKYRPRSHYLDSNFGMALDEVVAANK
ncbi:uncharacterized protein LOC141905375 [Tubulanus polymorphus]|uniref:uncharacterized protein LOC141905375 n=1 Tax=Tubulanus polymorphus TaxID=672921 RepID=UPI003DA597EB